MSEQDDIEDGQPPAPEEKPERRQTRGNVRTRERRSNRSGCSDIENRWLDHYLVHGNAALAAKEAYGVDGKERSWNALKVRGHEIRHRPHIVELLNELQEKAQNAALMTRVQLLEKLRENIDAAATAEQYAASNSAIKLYGGELHQMFSDRVDLRVMPAVEQLLETARPFCRLPETYADFVQALHQAAGIAGLVAEADDAGDGVGADGPH
jgi:hypothetical protein